MQEKVKRYWYMVIFYKRLLQKRFVVGKGIRKFCAWKQKSDTLVKRNIRCWTWVICNQERAKNKPESPQFLKDFGSLKLYPFFKIVFIHYLSWVYLTGSTGLLRQRSRSAKWFLSPSFSNKSPKCAAKWLQIRLIFLVSLSWFPTLSPSQVNKCSGCTVSIQ